MRRMALFLVVLILLLMQSCAAFSEEELTSACFASMETDGKPMQMRINETVVTVEWEDNDAVSALKGLVRNAPLSIEMSMYGGFEQVGYLGESLARNDVQTCTQAGDIMLYAGDQIVVFYGSNSWAYTRLGRIADLSELELTVLLGNGDVTITLFLE